MDERKIITNAEEENRAVNPQDQSPEEAPTSKEASLETDKDKSKKKESPSTAPRENT